MKKILLALSIILLFSCNQPKSGDIRHQPRDFIEINGKIYKLTSVVPCDQCLAIWILYPKDTADKMPISINYTVPQGKSVVNQTVIKIE